MSTVTFGPRRYRLVADDIELRDDTDTSPSGWEARLRVAEEVTETLLAIHMSDIVGMPLVVLRRAWAMDPSVDLVAADRLGRLHLFELKTGSVGVQQAGQLEQYLLRHVFADPEAFRKHCVEDGLKQFEPMAVARYLSGAFANVRAATMGPAWVVRRLGEEHSAARTPSGRVLTKSSWQKLSPEEKARRLHAACEARVRGQYPERTTPPFNKVEELASRWSHRLRSGVEDLQVGFNPDRPLVIWLVGRSVQDGALERVRMWRRAGVDARVLRLEARFADGGWAVRYHREEAEQRDRLENRLLELADRNIEQGEAPELRCEFYEQVSASTPKSKGGALLVEPKGRTVIDGEKVKVTVGKSTD